MEVPLSDVAATLEIGDDRLTMVVLTLAGELGGTMVLTFDEENGRNLAAALLNRQAGSGDWSELEQSALNETGNILFRADFLNRDGLLRHGQTGTLLLHRTLEGAIVIPQRSTFEVLDKQYVYVVDESGTAHQRLITVAHEMDDVFVVASGLEVTDKIVLDGVRQVRNGEPVECEFQDPKLVLKNLKHRAE